MIIIRILNQSILQSDRYQFSQCEYLRHFCVDFCFFTCSKLPRVMVNDRPSLLFSACCQTTIFLFSLIYFPLIADFETHKVQNNIKILLTSFRDFFSFYVYFWDNFILIKLFFSETWCSYNYRSCVWYNVKRNFVRGISWIILLLFIHSATKSLKPVQIYYFVKY